MYTNAKGQTCAHPPASPPRFLDTWDHHCQRIYSIFFILYLRSAQYSNKIQMVEISRLNYTLSSSQPPKVGSIFFHSSPLSTVGHDLSFSREAGMLPFSWDLGEKHFFYRDFRYTLHKHQKGQTTTTLEENLTQEPDSQHIQIQRLLSSLAFS